MNGILLEQGFLGDGESPNNRVPPHRGGRRLPQKPPSLLGGSSLFTALVADLFIAITGGTISKSVLVQPFLQKVQNWIAGTVLIALGLRLIISER
jgi:hypothetical protein